MFIISLDLDAFTVLPISCLYIYPTILELFVQNERMILELFIQNERMNNELYQKIIVDFIYHYPSRNSQRK